MSWPLPSQSFVELLATHTLTATALGIVVLIANRFIRHAPTRHALWLIVLLKLVTPPVVELAVLPAPPTTVAVTPTTVTPTRAATRDLAPLGDPAPAELAVAAAGSNAPRGGSGALMLLALLATGSLATMALALVRLARFRRLIAAASPAPMALHRRMAALGEELGLRRLPSLRLIDATFSPALWSSWRGVLLLFPTPLLERLSAAEVDAVLAHELAHIRRRDHWVRFVELAASILYWWHPLVWFARRALRRAEERSCDAWVAAVLPGRARAYANGLLTTLSLLTRTPDGQTALPATATAMNTRDDLEERLTMIITERTPKLLSPISRGAIALLALGVLAVLPIRAERATSADTANTADTADTAERDEAITEYEARRLELERQALELESQMVALEDQRLELEAQAEALERDSLHVELERRAEALAAEGDTAGLEALTLRRELLEEEHALRDRDRALERKTRTRARELEREAREHALRARELESRGAHDQARELAERARAMQRARVEVEREHRQRAHDLQQEAIAHRQRTLGLERDAAEAAGRMEAVQELERAMLAHRFEAEKQAVHQRLEAELEERIHALEAEHRQATGDLEAEIAAEIERLRGKLEAVTSDRPAGY